MGAPMTREYYAAWRRKNRASINHRNRERYLASVGGELREPKICHCSFCGRAGHNVRTCEHDDGLRVG